MQMQLQLADAALLQTLPVLPLQSEPQPPRKPPSTEESKEGRRDNYTVHVQIMSFVAGRIS